MATWRYSPRGHRFQVIPRQSILDQLMYGSISKLIWFKAYRALARWRSHYPWPNKQKECLIRDEVKPSANANPIAIQSILWVTQSNPIARLSWTLDLDSPRRPSRIATLSSLLVNPFTSKQIEEVGKMLPLKPFCPSNKQSSFSFWYAHLKNELID